VLDALQRHMVRREAESLLAGSAWKDSGRVFTTTIGTELDADKLSKIFHELSVAAEVPQIRFHDLRHTCGTFLHAQGVSPFTIQEILGHAQIVTTRRYTHIDTSLQKSALAKIGELLKKPEPEVKTATPRRRLVRVK
jgi:integrase